MTEEKGERRNRMMTREDEAEGLDLGIRMLKKFEERYREPFGRDMDLYYKAIDLFLTWAISKGYRMDSFVSGEDYDEQQRFIGLAPANDGSSQEV